MTRSIVAVMVMSLFVSLSAAQGQDEAGFVSMFNGKPGTVMAMEPAPGANPLTVAGLIHEEMAEIKQQLPSGLQANIVYDASDYIRESIKEVFTTLFEAMLVVLLVVKAFDWWWEWLPRELFFLILGLLALAVMTALRRLRVRTA